MRISEDMGDSPAHAPCTTRSRADDAGSAGGRSTFGRLPAKRADRMKQIPQLRGAAKRRARPQSERAATQQEFAALRAARLRGSHPRPQLPATLADAARWHQPRKQARCNGQPAPPPATTRARMLRAFHASQTDSDLSDGLASSDGLGASAAASRLAAPCEQQKALPDLALRLRDGGISDRLLLGRTVEIMRDGCSGELLELLDSALVEIIRQYAGKGAAADAHRGRLRGVHSVMKRLCEALNDEADARREDGGSDSGCSDGGDSGGESTESALAFDEADVPASGRCPRCGEDARDCWDDEQSGCDAPWLKRRRRD
jgi:hypothetical protein